ncbi:MAG: hypothetical protein CME70_00445 [Halobacteriovorax sp.]|nr:hypothetical protein [Halobacteriovorax sp.]|tara:strand:+ start:38998 stop:39840 length:843 start_codon:yes stop_codon:yes gene_type:complete
MFADIDLTLLNNNFDNLLIKMGVSRKDIYELCRVKGDSKITSLSVLDIQKIVETLNIDLRELGKNNVCSKIVRKQLLGEREEIRENLIGNQGTRIKTIESALSLLDQQSRKEILRKYQLNEDVFKDGAKLVSAEFIKSVFKDLTKFSFAKSSEIVGHVNCKNFLGSKFDKELKQFKSPAEAYSYFIEYCTTVVEKNMDYKILSATPNKIIFKYETKEEVKDFFKVKHFGNINFCQNIQGFFEELVKYRYTYPATVRKLSCAHLGSSSCTYEIIFDGIVTH